MIVQYDLRDDVPPEIGCVSGIKTRVYGIEDVPAILDSIAERVASEKRKHGLSVVDFQLYGFVNEQVLLALGINISGWDDIAEIRYGNPHAAPRTIFPLGLD